MKAPAIQLYTGDWMKDPALRACGPLARGVWIDCLCLMHESEEKGVLRFNGKPVTNDQIARMIGATPAEVRKAINELEGAGVFSRHEDGAIYSRRMVRDAKLIEQRREWGKLGGEHGTKGREYGAKGGRPPKDKNPPSDSNKGGLLTPSEPPPSSSSSTSVKESDTSYLPPVAENDSSKVSKAKPKTPTGPHQEAIADFCGRWRSKYGEKYPFNAGKDAEAVKWMRTQVDGDNAKLSAIFARFFDDDDPHHAAGSRHAVASLRLHFARWLVAKPPPTKPKYGQPAPARQIAFDVPMSPPPPIPVELLQ